MKYRKKPVVIEAEQWFPGRRVEGVTEFTTGDAITEIMGRIKTLEDTEDSYHYVSPGDWIITGVKGERYAVKPDIFEKTYEAVVGEPMGEQLAEGRRFAGALIEKERKMKASRKLPEITREEFIKLYFAGLGTTWEEVQKTRRVIPAAEDTFCNFEECQGWHMVPVGYEGVVSWASE